MNEFEKMHTPMTDLGAVKRNKRKIVRCEFCKASVSGPYKGIHKETELINGIPTQCRNNGKANIHLYMGYGKKKVGDEWVNDTPKENTFWLVEDPETRLWYNGFGGWTKDPNEAFKMEFKWVADRFARMEKIEKYELTEHEFFSYHGKHVVTVRRG